PAPPSPPLSSAWFPYQQGWLGADGAYSVPLGGDRILWIFGDTFIGAPGATSRKHATGFIHNSIAISTCPGKVNCTFWYHWQRMNTPNPRPMFFTGTGGWFWPMDGFVDRGTLYVALMQMHSTGTGGPFGFAYSGVQLASIHNYAALPSQWSVTYQKLNTGGSAIPGVSIIVEDALHGNPDSSTPRGADYVYFFTLVGSSTPAMHLSLLRLPRRELHKAARPGKAAWEYLASDSTWRPWAETATVLPGDSAAVFRPGATEMTVRYHSSTHQWIAVYPGGLANAAYYSLSPAMTGPWGPAKKLYAYPEMEPANPNYTPNVFCYAAKEHVELEAPEQLFFTYACNSSREGEVIGNMNLYHPVVVTQPLPRR
ncbi:MAG: DUF4185 domain-containing protein, partial [Terriglobia bacterium]